MTRFTRRRGVFAALILAVLVLPLWPALAILPLLGTMLNGTSSVLYGTVPELRTGARAESAFAMFYTGVIGAGAIAPVGFGYLGDAAGSGWATVATAAAAKSKAGCCTTSRLPRA